MEYPIFEIFMVGNGYIVATPTQSFVFGTREELLRYLNNQLIEYENNKPELGEEYDE